MKKGFLVLHLLVLGLCLSTYLNQWVLPTQTPYIEFVALGFPFLFTLYLAFVVGWYFIDKKKILLFLGLGILVVPLVQPSFSLSSHENPTGKKEVYKLLTYNTKYFEKDPKSSKKWIKKQKVDVLLLQEYRDSKKKYEQVTKNYAYSHESYRTAIFSQHPIISKKRYLHDKKGEITSSDIVLGQDTVRFFSVYLSSFRFKRGAADQSLLSESNWGRKNTLFQQVKKNLICHQNEVVDVLLPALASSPYPVVLGGDFNSVANSFEYFQVKKHLADAFLQKGNGFGFTFQAFQWPIRIDYVFVSDQIKSIDYQIPSVSYSDHRPVLFTFTTQEKKVD